MEVPFKNDNLIAVIRRKIALGNSEKNLAMKLTTFEKHRIVTFYSLERGLLQDPSQKKDLTTTVLEPRIGLLRKNHLS